MKIIDNVILIMFISTTFYITWRWSYKLLVLLLAAINENPDRTEKNVILKMAKKDKLWHDVAKELGLYE